MTPLSVLGLINIIVTYTQVWYIIGIVSSSPTYFHSERIGLTRVTTYLPICIRVKRCFLVSQADFCSHQSNFCNCQSDFGSHQLDFCSQQLDFCSLQSDFFSHLCYSQSHSVNQSEFVSQVSINMWTWLKRKTMNGSRKSKDNRV